MPSFLVGNEGIIDIRDIVDMLVFSYLFISTGVYSVNRGNENDILKGKHYYCSRAISSMIFLILDTAGIVLLKEAEWISDITILIGCIMIAIFVMFSLTYMFKYFTTQNEE